MVPHIVAPDPRARAAVLSRLTTTSAHMTTSAEAQSIEDELQAVAQHRQRAGSSRDAAQSALDAIDEKLLGLSIPTDEWDILYRVRLQVERDVLLGDRAERRRETSPDRL